MSNRLYKSRVPENVLLENGIKHFLRYRDHLHLFAYFALVACYPLFLMPITGKMVYMLAFSYVYYVIGKKVWLLFMDDDFMKLYRWDDEVKVRALQKATKIFAMTGYTVLTIGFCVTMLFNLSNVWIALSGVAVIALGYLAIYVLSESNLYTK